MKRILLDTNIYGLIVKDADVVKIRYNVPKKKDIIYGIDIIRKELRNTPKKAKILDKNLRVSMLTIYDTFVGKHTIITSEKMESIAKKYYSTYKKLGGMMPPKELEKDYTIVACASLKDMDIVVSNDKHTMLGDFSRKAFDIVNDVLGISTPNFWEYNKFKRWVL